MEEAIETAKSICNSDPSAVLLVLHPLEHASTDKVNVTKNRRNLEDTLMGLLGSQELVGAVGIGRNLSLTFS